ncbi:OR1C1 protein, partial [Atractosteus spatula]|nr:OR1C1 protein [Atractosteus spatula]
MRRPNITLDYEFIIVGLPNLQEQDTALFVIFLILFMATFLGNLVIVALISLDHRLHVPMYFFLWNLAVLDILITTTIIPKMLVGLLGHKTISLSGCFAQMYFIISFTAVEGFLVAAMAYDRYVAVVKPLHYNNLINTKACITMMSTAWVLGFLAPLLSVILASTLPFCGSNLILHIVCDYRTVVLLSCSDATAQINFTLLIAMLAICIQFLYVLWTYCRIIASVMKLETVESHEKAFSMCSSHVTVVFLYYVSGAAAYIGLRVDSIPPDGRIIIGAVHYFLTPLLNPIIYSLRNEKIKAAGQRYFKLRTRPVLWFKYTMEKVKLRNEQPNITLHSEFIIMGLPILQEQDTALFIIFLILFLATFLGNLLIVLLITFDQHFHTPMYFFLWNLAVLDILLSTSAIPKMLVGLLGNKIISFSGCFAQMYFLISFTAIEGFLVAAMAHDRYVAVVKPLHYNTLINTKACITMMSTAWVLGFLAPLLSVVLASTLSFCGSNFILHIVCDYHSVMSLACGDVTAQMNFTLSIAMLSIYVPFLYVLWTYCRIIASVMKLKIVEGRKKAFSMCSSHVTVVFLYYASGAVVYIGLREERIPPDGCIFIGGLNYFLTPLLNPIIYSLRNEKIKAAVQMYFKQRILSCQFNKP